ncbi:hypothetical protein [Sandarakinorhabdus oryzae]|uniref:hypothetical protein n=1 Tax=Sandarakinorhabdus oryzae TaxID=2675220 RepID=UPI0012E27B54|nr:hypothetical protein [Sandarakinorhabdus oryzae]
MQYSSTVTQSATKFVAESRFKVAPQKWTVTLILAQAYSSNTFYEKHVLRKGENPGTVAAQRKKITSDNNFYGVDGKNINHATFILLDRIDVRDMVYGLCQAVVANQLAGNLPAVNGYIANLPIEAAFDAADCVVTIHQGGAPTKCRSIKVGGTLRGLDAVNNRIAFEIDHSGGQGAT